MLESLIGPPELVLPVASWRLSEAWEATRGAPGPQSTSQRCQKGTSGFHETRNAFPTPLGDAPGPAETAYGLRIPLVVSGGPLMVPIDSITYGF